MDRRDPQILVALAVLGLVVIAIGGIVATRFGTVDRLDGVRYGGFGAGVDGRPDCAEAAGSTANLANPWEGATLRHLDGATETVGGEKRGWSLQDATYEAADAAQTALDNLALLYTPAFKECFRSDIRQLTFPGEVRDGYATGEVSGIEGAPEQTYHALWRDDERLLSFSAWTTSQEDITTWVRARYEAARAEWD